MQIKCPKVVFQDNKPHQLYVDYMPNKDKEYEWKITYVGENSILYRKANKNLTELELDVLQFIKENHLMSE